MSDKRLEIKISSSANETKTSVDAVTSSLKAMKKQLSDSGYAIKGIKQIQDQMGNYTKTVVTATKGTETLKQTINSVGKTTGIQKITKEAKTAKSSLSQMFNVGKIYAFWNVTKRIRDSIKGMITSAIDFIETTNKFEVSMGKMEESGYKFINTVSERFGLARDELMDYQSTYNNIMKSLSGITEETAYKISESVTKMAIDYASLYNVSTDEAMTKFQSALVGSVRPIRSDSGYDITETTIGEKATELGIERPVRQLNQMEKRLLRIIVLMEQMRKTGAMGDFARTIEQPANQLKVLSNQLKELGIWLGNVFMGTLGKILPYVNGFVMVLKELAKMLAFFVGYENVGSIADPLQDASESTSNIAGNLGGAAASAKELKKTLMGFDVLNVIQTPSSGGGGGGSAVGNIDPKILNAMKEYDNLMANVSMKATKIRDRIMEWLGFTKHVNEETGEITWTLDEGYTNLEKIRDILKVIGGIIGVVFGLKLLDSISKIVLAFTTMQGFSTMFPNLAIMVTKLKEFVITVGFDKIMLIVTKIAGVIAGLAMGIDGIINYVKELKEPIVNVGNAIGRVIEIVTGIGLAIAAVFGLIPGLIASLVAAVGTLIYTLVTKWEEFTVGLKYIWDTSINWLSEKWEAFTVGLKYIWDTATGAIKDALSTLGNAFKTTWQSVKDGWQLFIDNTKNTFNNFKDKFVSGWNNIKSSVTGVIDKIKSSFTSFKDTLTGAIDKIKDKWTNFKNNFTLPKIKTPHFSWGTTPATGWVKTVLEALNIPASLPKLSVSWYAQGGLPDVGEMFVAREAGPELVGTIGNKSAVVNNDQIVEAVSQGVAQAVSSVMGSNGGSYHLYIDGQEITDVVSRRMSRMANITGGYAYGQ